MTINSVWYPIFYRAFHDCMVVRFYNYLCNQCVSPLALWVWIPLDTTLCDKVCQWFAAGRCFFLDDPVCSANIKAILLKVALDIITVTLIRNFTSNIHMLFNIFINELWNLFILFIKWKENKYHIVGTKSNIEVVERGKIDTFNTQIHDLWPLTHKYMTSDL